MLWSFCLATEKKKKILTLGTACNGLSEFLELFCLKGLIGLQCHSSLVAKCHLKLLDTMAPRVIL